MEKIKLVMTRNKDDEKDLFDMLGTKEDRKEFDRQFKMCIRDRPVSLEVLMRICQVFHCDIGDICEVILDED